jgi:hypothetical protein
LTLVLTVGKLLSSDRPRYSWLPACKLEGLRRPITVVPLKGSQTTVSSGDSAARAATKRCRLTYRVSKLPPVVRSRPRLQVAQFSCGAGGSLAASPRLWRLCAGAVVELARRSAGVELALRGGVPSSSWSRVRRGAVVERERRDVGVTGNYARRRACAPCSSGVSVSFESWCSPRPDAEAARRCAVAERACLRAIVELSALVTVKQSRSVITWQSRQAVKGAQSPLPRSLGGAAEVAPRILGRAVTVKVRVASWSLGTVTGWQSRQSRRRSSSPWSLGGAVQVAPWSSSGSRGAVKISPCQWPSKSQRLRGYRRHGGGAA